MLKMTRKIIISLILLSLVLSMFLLVACQAEDEAIPMESTQPTQTSVKPTSTTQASPTIMVAEATSTEVPSVEPIETIVETPEPAIDLGSTETDVAVPVSEPLEAIEWVEVVAGLDRPTYLTHAGDERIFVTEQAGRILIIKGNEVNDEPFLDIRDRVGSVSLEQGLLSMAFHPDYPNDRRFFVNYTDKNGSTVVSSFLISEENQDIAIPSSEEQILFVQQPYANHNGGQLQFGPDGYLYIGMGDGGSAGDPLNSGQNPTTLLGTILRLNIDGDGPYTIPESNPFAAENGNRGEIWAIGLRNPWRFSFDADTGDLFIADVGQNQWEEINFQPSNSSGGENYGWNVLEGTHCFQQGSCDPSNFVMPIAEYNHTEGGCSVTGGYVYRGEEQPKMDGNYLFGDYCSGRIWSLFQDQDDTWIMNGVLDSEFVISSFGVDSAGEIYILDHNMGSINRVVGR